MVTCFGSILLMMVQSRGCKMLQQRHSRNELETSQKCLSEIFTDAFPEARTNNVKVEKHVIHIEQNYLSPF